jgi:hypothetical protein
MMIGKRKRNNLKAIHAINEDNWKEEQPESINNTIFICDLQLLG